MKSNLGTGEEVHDKLDHGIGAILVLDFEQIIWHGKH